MVAMYVCIKRAQYPEGNNGLKDELRLHMWAGYGGVFLISM